MVSTIVGSENDIINMVSTIVGSGNNTINMKSIIPEMDLEIKSKYFHMVLFDIYYKA